MYAEISINSNGTRSYYSVFGKADDVALALETAAAQNDTLRQALAILAGKPKMCSCGHFSLAECEMTCNVGKSTPRGSCPDYFIVEDLGRHTTDDTTVGDSIPRLDDQGVDEGAYAE